jgi:hypothetical protein
MEEDDPFLHLVLGMLSIALRFVEHLDVADKVEANESPAPEAISELLR